MNQELKGELFEESVKKKIEEKKVSFIQAVYQTYDEFAEKEIENSETQIACKKGCSRCCYQLISCTEMEADEIIKYIMNLPKTTRRPLIVRFKKFAIKWYKYYEKNQSLFGVTVSPLEFKPRKDWRGKPCPFLNEENGSCDIYPVRIIDCRGWLSSASCSKEIETSSFRSQTYHLASNLIMEKQKEIGPFGVTPIYYWLFKKILIKQK